MYERPGREVVVFEDVEESEETSDQQHYQPWATRTLSHSNQTLNLYHGLLLYTSTPLVVTSQVDWFLVTPPDSLCWCCLMTQRANIVPDDETLPV